MVQVKEIEIGTGIPKICVPVVEKTQEEILNQAQNIPREYVDLVEWRADYYEDVFDREKVIQTASLLQSILGKIPLLFDWLILTLILLMQFSLMIYGSKNTPPPQLKYCNHCLLFFYKATILTVYPNFQSKIKALETKMSHTGKLLIPHHLELELVAP